ncbi:MAG: PAS domain S-box protein [Gammaproteobacteria bacterium]|nr:MAG: PAS domain S-box protein [Gammaproteobacteria bacterium]
MTGCCSTATVPGLDSVLDAAVDAIVLIDARGRIERFNLAAEALFGWRADEIIGQSAGVLMPDPFRSEHDDYIARYLRGGERRMIGSRREVNACRRDGSQVPVTITVGEVAGGAEPHFLAILHETAEAAGGFDPLHRGGRLLRQAQALAGVANYEARIPGGASIWSDEMYRIVGRDRALGPVALDSFVERYVTPADREPYRRRWQEAMTSGLFDMECRITTDQGVIRVVHSIAQMVPAEEGALQVTGTLYDVTERPRAADEMRLAQERMTQFARLSTMGEMAAGLAHEINQPLAAITTFSQALQRMIRNPAGAAREEIEEVLEQIAAQALRAGEVIHRLRVFLRNREVRQETVAPGQLIEDTLLFAEPDVRLSNIRVLLDVPRHLPAIDCDPVQIQQVLLNLVRNAIDAMNEAVTGPREIVVAGRLIESGELEISVADHGPGISREVAESFGNPFFTTKPSGTGLGVAISRSILRAHGGRFGHRPTPGGGATVFFTLPPAPGGSDE